MTNGLDYIAWRGDLSFERDPLNEVDIFLFSQLVAPDYSGIVPDDEKEISIKETADRYFENHTEDVSNLGVLQSTSALPMLKAMSESVRFGDLKLCGFVNKVNLDNEEQCCGLTVKLPGDIIFVVFRGTDDTIIGWKEDFNIATKDIVPAQEDAVKYLEWAASVQSGDIYICGHSKGGNLAMYSAAMCEDSIKDRIRAVYNFDGPGFQRKFLQTENYLGMKDKITTVLSQNSIVGTLLHRAGSVLMVNSCVAGPMAHDGFNWEIVGTKFTNSDGLSDVSKTIDRAMDETLDSMETEEKQAFIDELFDTLMSTGAITVTDFTNMSVQSFLSVLKSFRGDEKVNRFVAKVSDSVVRTVKERDEERFKEKLSETAKAGEAIKLKTQESIKAKIGGMKKPAPEEI